jgi:alginate O-acetyltransferase complex protein AlgI
MNLRNIVLLLASILFYAWGEPKYVLVMLATILINYLGALGIDRFKENKQIGRALIFVTIACDLAILGYFKYFNFLVENINALLKSNIDFVHVIMPIGISFYTFQAISYLIDVYRGDVKAQTNILKLALFITLFPQLVAGPIVKYHDVAEQIDNRTPDWNSIAMGVKRFIIGLSKKVLIANTMGAVATQILDNTQAYHYCAAIAWLAAIAYTLQIFFDFSGYSDMAIGLGQLFGFKFKENFNYPYISKSITEFWRRWHISLSTWFKEYVYIPLGGNRKGSNRTLVNIGIVFLLTGIWHGASWNFILWGLWHGLFNIIEKATGFHKDSGVKWKEALKHVYTLVIVVVGWVFFRPDTFAEGLIHFKQMLALEPTTPIYTIHYFMSGWNWFILFVGILLSMPIIGDKLYTSKSNQWAQLGVNALLIALFILCVASLSANTYNPFIYFRF